MTGCSRPSSFFARLGKDEHASSPALLARLLRDEEGSYLLYMTLVIPILIGVAALGAEAGLAFYNHRTIQSAADAAAYSAAIAYSNGDTSSTALTTQAEAIVAGYGFVVGTGNGQVNVNVGQPISNYAGTTNTAIPVTLTLNQAPILSSLYLNGAISVAGSATAVIAKSNKNGGCMLALGNTATGPNAANAVQLQGNPTVNLGSNCGLFSNSTDCSKGAFAVALGGNANIDAGALGAAGCISIGGHSSINLPPGVMPTSGDGAVMNPYAGITLPTASSPGSCTAGTCTPGVYSSGISLAGGTWTLQPGVYILESAGGNPAFQIGPGGGGTTVTGNGVTLVFTSATPGDSSSYPSTMMSVDSVSNVTLTAPTTGDTAGFVMMGDSTMPLGTSFDTHSNPNVTIDGTVYVPNGAFAWGGNPATGGSPATSGSNFCLQFIVNTITLYGDSAFNSSGCSFGGGQKPIGGYYVALVD
jgi:Flp pilus assembly protein TadG